MPDFGSRMKAALPHITALVPHRGSMLLVDRLLEASANHALGEVAVSERSAFYLSGLGVPAYVGIEYMAQTVAAYDGFQRWGTGEPPAIGFLLGTRRYVADRSFFKPGDLLLIRVVNVFMDNGMASFDCNISVQGEDCVSATLNVYRPEPGADFTADSAK